MDQRENDPKGYQHKVVSKSVSALLTIWATFIQLYYLSGIKSR